MYQLIIPAMTFLTVIGIGGAILVARMSRQRALQARIHGGRSYGATTFAPTPAGPRLMDALEQVGRVAASSGESASALREKLTQAGFHSLSAPTIYVGAQLMLVVVGLAMALLIWFALELSPLLRGCIAFVVVALLGLLPNIWVGARQRARRTEVRRHLPDAIDLLEICVSSGMGLDMAWNSVTDELRSVSQTLADEMALVNLEIHLGAPRSDALRNMARRTGVEDISSLVATLIQSERFGTSVSQALRTYADSLRAARSQRAEEAAEKLMVKMLVPMLIFIFPVIFIVILGPAGIKLIDVFSQTR